jgi:hypothetical protein
MCVFSQPVVRVSHTQIFARAVDEGRRQLLVYAMRLEANADLAMVLPVPVPAPVPDGDVTAEDAVRFVDLSGCPTFFDQLAACFPIPRAPRRARGELVLQSAPRSLLEVHDVGDFEASFVPTSADFTRLDPRFRLSPEVLASLPNYADWGFCVFQLRVTQPPAQEDIALRVPPSPGVVERVRRMFGGAPTKPAASPAGTGERNYHPMAFSFPRRDRDRLFFPTVHVHDGRVMAEAAFDHALYCQTADGREPVDEGGSWSRAPGIIDPTMAGGPVGTAAPWLEKGAPLYRKELRGDLPNADTWIGGGG